MLKSRRLMKEEQIIIFSGMEEPNETDFIRISCSAMNLLNLFSSKESENADNVMSDLETQMNEKLR